MSRPCGACGQDLPEPGESWGFVLPLEPPSQNIVAQNKGAGRGKYKRIRDSYEILLSNQRVLQKIARAKGRRRVLITRLYSGHGQERDMGNIVGGCKPLLDAMTRARLIVDDKPRFIEAHYFQERAKESGVAIRIEEMR